MTDAERTRARQAGRIEHHEAELYAAMERGPLLKYDGPAARQTLRVAPPSQRWRKVAFVAVVLGIIGWLLWLVELTERRNERIAYHERRGIEQVR